MSTPAHPPADDSLLELFRIEAEQCVATLNEGIVSLEAAVPDVGTWERLMRAAHSVKGAARIVELPDVAQLAHALEDCLVAAQARGIVLGADQIDLLLRSVDGIEASARAVGARDQKAQRECDRAALALIPQLQKMSQDRRVSAAPPSESQASMLSLVPLGALARESSRPESNLSLSPAAPTVPPMRRVEVRVRSSGETTDAAPERVLRISADRIERLMGLAGESLVASRGVASLLKSLQAARKQQMQLGELLASLTRSLSGGDASRAKQLVDDAKQGSRACQALLVQHGAELEGYVRNAEELGDRLYREALRSRMRPFGDGTRGLHRLVRDVSRQLGKRVRLEIVGQNVEVDREALERLDAPLGHLLRNAIDHGIELPEHRIARGKPEVGVLRIEARHHAGMLTIVVSDDGRGIDVELIRARAVARNISSEALAPTLSSAELLEFPFLPGFSTASSVSDISGRGVGLDVVRSSVEALGGSVRALTELGRMTSFSLQLPVTRSVIRAVVAAIDGESYAFPLLRIESLNRVPFDQIETLENRPYAMINSRPVALVSARKLFQLPEAKAMNANLNVIVICDRSQRFGIIVDEFCGEHDLVVRPLDPRLRKVEDLTAAAILVDGSIGLIVDVDDMMRATERILAGTAWSEGADGATRNALIVRKRVLVVDDSIAVREAERQLLNARGYEVDVAVDGMDGLNAVRRCSYDLVITDVDMPRMNGIELVRAIKQDPKLSAIPIVIVSYKDRDDDRLRGLEAGANYYLSKSGFHDDSLVQAVFDLIGGAAA